jgi:hypothetical protein
VRDAHLAGILDEQVVMLIESRTPLTSSGSGLPLEASSWPEMPVSLNSRTRCISCGSGTVTLRRSASSIKSWRLTRFSTASFHTARDSSVEVALIIRASVLA